MYYLIKLFDIVCIFNKLVVKKVLYFKYKRRDRYYKWLNIMDVLFFWFCVLKLIGYEIFKKNFFLM